MVWNKIKDVFVTPVERSSLAGASAGKVILTGTIAAGDEELRSPIHGYACVAFFYRATWKAKTRDSETTRVHRQAERYAQFFLELEDASLPVVSRRSEDFGKQDHMQILAAGIPGLEPAEQLVRAGDRVRLHGRLHTGEQTWLELVQLDILEARPLEVAAGNRKARRKQRRDQRRARR
jgi:hypothetical protein